MATELARMQQRRDTALAWTANNPVLSAGEIGFESDTGKFKIGDGSTVWASLTYQGATGTAGVSSFNTRTGAVALSKADVTGTGLAAADVSADVSGAAAAATASAAQKAANLSDLASVATARTNLGLGTAATQASTAFDAAGAASAAQAASLQKTSNLSDVADVDSSRASIRVPVLRECRVAATANVASLSGTTTIDGVALAAGDRVLLTAQTTGSQNGPWLVQTGAWTRPNDYPAAGVLTSRLCPVPGGSTANQGIWQLKSTVSITVDTTATTWALPSGGSGGPGLGATWIDMCAAPYNHVPGDDITTDLQTVVNNAATNNVDTTIYFSKPGVYNINGAQQTGTDGTHTWSGQILIPKRIYQSTSGLLSITIKGASKPSGGSGGNLSGVILQTNATSGNVVDAIPGNTGTGSAYTFIELLLEDIILRAPTNPQLNSFVNGAQLANLEIRGNVTVDTTASTTTLTGTGAALIFPPFNNMAISGQTSGYLTIIAWPVAFAHAEHFVLNDCQVDWANIASKPYGGLGHTSQYRRLLLQGCAIGIQPTQACSIEGLVDIGDTAGGQTLSEVIHDPSDFLKGTLMVGQWGASGAPGFPGTAGKSLRLIPMSVRPSEWPSDDFTRIPNGSTSFIGYSANTHHGYVLKSGSTFSVAGGVLKSTHAGATSEVHVYHRGPSRAGGSRVIRNIFALSGTYNVWQLAGLVIAGAKANNAIVITIQSGVVAITISVSGASTTLASSAAATVAAGNTYTIDTVVSNPIGGPYAVSVYKNGVIIPITLTSGGGSVVSNTYQLSATEIANLVDTDNLQTQDGFGFFSDLNSSCSQFAVFAGG